MADLATFYDPSDTLYKSNIVIEFYHLISKITVTFKAFLTDFKDDYSQEWEESKAYGRMDPIETFSRTVRKITLSWDLVAASEEEAVNNLKKCSALAAMQYPTYSTNDTATSIASSPLFKLKFMNLAHDVTVSPQKPSGNQQLNNIVAKVFSFGLIESSVATSAREAGLLGRMKGFTFVPVLDEGSFIIEGSMYPKYCKLNCDFTVYHTHPLGWDSNGNPRQQQFPYGLSYDIKDTTTESKVSTVDTIATATENLILGLFK